MKKTYLLTILVCLFLGTYSFSQDKQLVHKDSLESLFKKGSLNISAYNYEQATEDSQLLISLANTKNDPYYASKGYNNLGHVYLDLRDTVRARINYPLGLENAQQVNNDTLLLDSYNNLGNIYSEIPETIDKGIAYYNKVIAIADSLDFPSRKIIPKVNIGWTYLDRNDYDRAYPYLSESLSMLDDMSRNETNNSRLNYFYSQLYMLHGRYFTDKNQLDSAKVYFENSIALAEKDSLIIPAAEAYRNYAAMLTKDKEYQEANKALEKFISFNSLVYEGEKLKQMEISNAKYSLSEYKKNLEIAKREQEYQSQIIDKSNEKVIVMVLSSLVLMFILFYLNKVNSDRKKLILQLKGKNRQFKDAKEEAEKLSRLKTRFFSTVSHELRTPLYGVIGLTSLLMEDKELEKHKTDLKSLKFSADYLLALINDVLQMNKMESNQVNLESISFNFYDLINSIVSSFEFTRVQNKNTIHLDIDKNIPDYLIGDPVRLSQILMNLVGNAMKFTERGNIYIIARLKNTVNHHAQIYFEVKDDGLGIPENKQKMIFEEFSQLRTANYNYQGTGLGLPIVKKLLNLFGSEIHLQSKDGAGSSFSFTIEFKEDNTKKEVVQTIEVSNEDTTTKFILIVDDNRINQVVTKRILEKRNFICDVAEDGYQAIKMAKKKDYDLILMDVNMPGITGLEACEKIRKFNTKVPVVALTAVEIEEIREEIFKAGMTDIIVKPYDVQQFYQTIYRNLVAEELSEKI